MLTFVLNYVGQNNLDKFILNSIIIYLSKKY